MIERQWWRCRNHPDRIIGTENQYDPLLCPWCDAAMEPCPDPRLEYAIGMCAMCDKGDEKYRALVRLVKALRDNKHVGKLECNAIDMTLAAIEGGDEHD